MHVACGQHVQHVQHVAVNMAPNLLNSRELQNNNPDQNHNKNGLDMANGSRCSQVSLDTHPFSVHHSGIPQFRAYFPEDINCGNERVPVHPIVTVYARHPDILSSNFLYIT
jgi:hypothetical protein